LIGKSIRFIMTYYIVISIIKSILQIESIYYGILIANIIMYGGFYERYDNPETVYWQYF
jgi:hypothetical protein